MAQEFWKADEPAEIAQDYLGMHPDLVGANIAFIFKEKASKRDGQPIVGKAMKVPEKYKCLMEETDSGDVGYDFILEFGFDAWQELNANQKAAWVDHCLEMCYGEENTSGEIVWKLRKPEIAAFSVILQRHGVRWDTGVNKLSVVDLGRHDHVLVEPTTRVQNDEETLVEPVQDVSTS